MRWAWLIAMCSGCLVNQARYEQNLGRFDTPEETDEPEEEYTEIGWTFESVTPDRMSACAPSDSLRVVGTVEIPETTLTIKHRFGVAEWTDSAQITSDVLVGGTAPVAFDLEVVPPSCDQAEACPVDLEVNLRADELEATDIQSVDVFPAVDAPTLADAVLVSTDGDTLALSGDRKPLSAWPSLAVGLTDGLVAQDLAEPLTVELHVCPAGDDPTTSSGCTVVTGTAGQTLTADHDVEFTLPGSITDLSCPSGSIDLHVRVADHLCAGEVWLEVFTGTRLVSDDCDADSFDYTTDCNDDDDTVNPDATETYYDGVDQDCDQASDYDADGDGVDSDQHGGTDCDDTDDAVFPGQTEVFYDGDDENCDPSDEYDADGDGFDSDDHGGTDCDDTNAAINPDADEVFYDGVDQACDGGDDYDADGDGDRSDQHGGTDCDDTDPEVKPGLPEICDGKDNDCANGADDDDENVQGATTFYADKDEDGFGASGDTAERCAAGTGSNGTAYIADSSDCDDWRDTVNPDAEEFCDGLDSDCDNTTDDPPITLFDTMEHFTDLQDAIDASASGHWIFVCEGTYEDNFVIPHDLRIWGQGSDVADVVLTIPNSGSGTVVEVMPQATAEMFSLTIDGGTGYTDGTIAEPHGGSAYIHDGGELNLQEAVVQGGQATRGGCTYGTISSYNATIRNCSADYGGCAAAADTYIDLELAELSGCSAAVHGGGMFVDNSTLDFGEATVEIVDNTSVEHGAGIYLMDSDLIGGEIDSNDADGWGGGVFVIGDSTITDTVISQNFADNMGGGIYVDSDGSLTLSGATLNSNTASGNGGGLANDAVLVPTVITNTLFNGNTGFNAGAVFVRGGTTVNMTGGRLRNNQALVDGGAVYSQGTFNGDGITQIDSNTAGQDGGAIYSVGDLDLFDVPLELNTTDRNGGAIVIPSNAGAVRLEQVDIDSNTATGAGGGIHTASPLSGTSLTVDSNAAITDGGGFWVAGSVVVSLDTSTVTNNTADQGAAFYLDGGTVNLDDSFVQSNTSTSGGVVHVSPTATELDSFQTGWGGSVSGNDNGPADIYLEDTNATVDYGTSATFICTPTACTPPP